MFLQILEEYSSHKYHLNKSTICLSLTPSLELNYPSSRGTKTSSPHFPIRGPKTNYNPCKTDKYIAMLWSSPLNLLILDYMNMQQETLSSETLKLQFWRLVNVRGQFQRRRITNTVQKLQRQFLQYWHDSTSFCTTVGSCSQNLCLYQSLCIDGERSKEHIDYISKILCSNVCLCFLDVNYLLSYKIIDYRVQKGLGLC